MGEQAVGDHANDGVELHFQPFGVCDGHALDVQNDVAVVGHHTLTPHRVATQLPDLAGHVFAGHGDHFHRQRELAQHLDCLGVVDDADELVGHGGDYLLAGQGGATALDHVAGPVDLVGAIHVDGEGIDVVEIKHRDAETLEALGGGDGARYRALDLVLHGRQCVDEVIDGRAGAHPDYGAGYHVFERSPTGRLLHFILSHDGSLWKKRAHYIQASCPERPWRSRSGAKSPKM
ncbi:hypothetical protein D3C86_857430 [compost metagenome]